MLPDKKFKVVRGTCEQCDKSDVILTISKGNISLCPDCFDIEQKAIQQIKAVAVIAQSHKVDETIQLSQDIHNAATVSVVELQAAIEHNVDIPAGAKRFALAKELEARIDKLSEIILVDQKALDAKRNERNGYVRNIQMVASTLRAEEREKIKQFDLNYKPVAISKVAKTTKPVKTARTYDKVAVFAAAKQYGVSAVNVQTRVVSSNSTPERAAAYLCEQVAKSNGLDEKAVKSIVLKKGVSAEEACEMLKQLLS